VPVIVTAVESLVITVGLILEIVGLVSAGKFVKLDASKVGVPYLALGIVPDVNVAAVIPGVIVTVSPPSPIVMVEPSYFFRVFTFISDILHSRCRHSVRRYKWILGKCHVHKFAIKSVCSS